MKVLGFLILSCLTLVGCYGLDNTSKQDQVECGESVSSDYFYVLDSQKNRVPVEELQILVRSGRTQAVSQAAATSKGCFSRDKLEASDIVLVKSPGRREAQIVRPDLIEGRTALTLLALPESKPNIVCNHNVVDTSLVLNQFVNFNQARLLEFYDISAAISLDHQLIDKTDIRPLLSAGIYDLKHLMVGKVYDLDMKIHDYVFSDGSAITTSCELDMDIPNLSAKLGDEIKQYRNYFGDSYGVVDQGYELNFYIEGGLKSVQIDYCVVRVSPEDKTPVNPETGCKDLGLPVKSYGGSDKGERFDDGFWLVLYRYKKGLLTKPWMAQRIMVRKICDVSQVKVDDMDRNYCTDIYGNVIVDGEQREGDFEFKYVSSVLGQLYVGSTNYQSVSLPNLAFASQLQFESNLKLKHLSVPQLSQVSLDLNIMNNHELENFKGLSKLERIGSNLFLSSNGVETLEGFENLKYIGADLIISIDSTLRTLNHLESLTTIGRDLKVHNLVQMKVLEKPKNLAHIGRKLRIEYDNELERIDFPGIAIPELEIVDNPKLKSLGTFDGMQRAAVVSLISNPKLASLKGFPNLVHAGFLEVAACPSLDDLTGMESLKSAGGIRISGNLYMTDVYGLENLVSLDVLEIISNGQLRSIWGLKSLARLTTTLSIQSNPLLWSIGKTKLNFQTIESVNIADNWNLTDLAMLSQVETIGALTLKNNFGVKSLQDLQHLHTVQSHMDISNTLNKATLDGLSNLKRVGGFLTLTQVESLAPLSSLASVGNQLSISNVGVSDLSDLKALKTIGGKFFLTNNTQLKSLEGLASLESVEGFSIQGSPDLVADPCSYFAGRSGVTCSL